ncbi:NRT1/ PTR family 2.7-like protein [Tanacetum coccineum]
MDIGLASIRIGGPRFTMTTMGADQFDGSNDTARAFTHTLNLKVVLLLSMARVSMWAGEQGGGSSRNSTCISLFILDRLIFPMWQHLTGRSLTPLQQVRVGNVLNVAAMVSSAFLEVQRLHVARLYHLMGSRTGATTVVQFSALWLVGPLTVLGISKAFHFPAQVSLYYQEFPTSLCTHPQL